MCKLTSQIPIVHESLSRNLSAPNHHSPHFGSTFIFPEFNRSTSYSNMHDPYDQSQLLSIVRYTDVQNMTSMFIFIFKFLKSYVLKSEDVLGAYCCD